MSHSWAWISSQNVEKVLTIATTTQIWVDGFHIPLNLQAWCFLLLKKWQLISTNEHNYKHLKLRIHGIQTLWPENFNSTNIKIIIFYSLQVNRCVVNVISPDVKWWYGWKCYCFNLEGISKTHLNSFYKASGHTWRCVVADMVKTSHGRSLPPNQT